jgi:hypothetical protein
MLRTTPSRIELKQEDIREYEETKEGWRNELKSSNTQNKGQDGVAIHQDFVKNAQKNDRHTRMGYIQKK